MKNLHSYKNHETTKTMRNTYNTGWEKEDIICVWKSHFEKLVSKNVGIIRVDTEWNEEPRIKTEKTEKAKDKTAGLHHVTGETLKIFYYEFDYLVYISLHYIMIENEVSEDWNMAIILSIFTKGD